jgi:hypothetical protein
MTGTSIPFEEGVGLKRNAIGLPEVLFQSITHMAPAVATALSIGAATGFAGRLTPLAVVFAMVACLFTGTPSDSSRSTCPPPVGCTRMSRVGLARSSGG